MAVPTRDNALPAWSTTFNSVIVASASTYQLSAPQVTAYTALHTPYIAAAAAAADPAQRNRSLIAARNSAREALLPYARQLYLQIQANAAVSDQAKIDAGIVIRKTEPTPVPPPADAPMIDVISTRNRTVRIRLHGEDSTRRAKPTGVSGAAVFSFTGAVPPPPGEPGWHFEGNTSQTITEITFPNSVPNGATVWVLAFWFNNRKQSGPPSDPASANLPGSVTSTAA